MFAFFFKASHIMVAIKATNKEHVTNCACRSY
jgi:hypothetical protein